MGIATSEDGVRAIPHAAPAVAARAPLAPPRLPASRPLVVVDAPALAGPAAASHVSFVVAGAGERLHPCPVTELAPRMRGSRVPRLDELTASLDARTAMLGEIDAVGIGVGALVVLRLAIGTGRVGRIVAVDAPTPYWHARAWTPDELLYGPSAHVAGRDRRRHDRFGEGAGAPRPAPGAERRRGAEGASTTERRIPDDAPRLRRPARAPGAVRRDELTSLDDHELMRVEVPMVCVNSRGSAMLTGGDHLARLVPTATLVRLRSGDPGDAADRASVVRAITALFSAGR